jgi:glycosyltransferase involved in cell wall biosynthesis
MMGRLRAWCRQQAALRLLYRTLTLRAIREKSMRRHAESLVSGFTFAPGEGWTHIVPVIEAQAMQPCRLPLTPTAHGVNVVGYLRGEFGLAESARAYARALMGYGVSVSLYNLELGVAHSMADTSLVDRFDTDLPEKIAIIFINPDYFATALREIGEAKLDGKYVIACWFWELERVPDHWQPVFAQVDEVLVASSFIEQAVRNASDRPVLRAPIPLVPLARADVDKAGFGLDPHAFLFLFTFDFNSWMERKNPAAVMEAFQRAFPRGDEHVQLLIKTSNANLHPQRFRELLDWAQGDARIVIRNGVITREQMTALQACCDAYVSLHRAEGFGMGMAECMQLGKPVIATNWSGNMEFMDEDSAALVRHTLIPVSAEEYPDGQGQRWAEPDTTHAAEWMGRLARDPVFAAALGERGRRHVHEVLSPDRVAAEIVARVDHIHSRWSASADDHAGFDARRGE